MPDPFDPYYRWLAIPPYEQPPNHYRLLGLQLFEENPDVIQSAADQRMAHLRTFQTGKHGPLSQKLLNEVAAAKLCLLSPRKRAAYDDALRQQLAARQATLAPPQPQNVQRPSLGILLGGIAVGVLLLTGLLVWGLASGDDPAGQIATAKQPQDGTNESTDQRPDASTDLPRPEPAPQPAQEPPPAAELSPDTEPPDTEPPDTELSPGTEPSSHPEASTDTKPGPEETAPDSAPPMPDGTTQTPTVEPEGPSNGPSKGSSTAEVPDQPPRPLKKTPVPSSEAQQDIVAQLDDVYGLAQTKTSAQQLELAGRLLELSAQAKQNPTERFVLVRKAAELACDGGDAAVMLGAVEAIAADFDVDELALTQELLVRFAEAPADAERIGSLVEYALPVVDQAVADGRCDVALDVIDATYRACAGSAGKDYRKQVYDRRNQVQKLHKTWQQFQDALITLKTTPDDHAANLTVGRWHCLRRGDWEQGLPCLAKCSDEGLKTAAAAELNPPPTTPTDQIKLADAWWDLAQAADTKSKTALLLHAGTWYEKAQPSVTSVVIRDKLAQRLGEIAKLQRSSTEAPTAPAPHGSDRANPQLSFQAGGEIKRGRWVDVLRAADTNRDRVAGTWTRIDETVSVPGQERPRLMLPVRLEGSYDLAVEFTPSAATDEANHCVVIVLPAGLGQCLLILGWRDCSGLDLVNGLCAKENVTTRKLGALQAGRRYTAMVRVQLANDDAAIAVSLNGVSIIRWTGKQASLSLDNGWPVTERTQPGLGADRIPVAFHSARLRLLSGKATWARPAGTQPDGRADPHGGRSRAELAKTTPLQQNSSDVEFEVRSSPPFVRLAKRGLRVRVLASGCNSHQICLNGAPLMKCSRDEPTGTVATLKEGDVLAVRLGDRFDVMSLWMVFQTQQGEYLFETSDKWNAYLPANRQQWWDVRNVRPGARKAQYAPDSREYVDLVKRAAQNAAPDHPRAQPVFSPLMGEDQYGDAYLYYVVTVEDLLPKRPRSATPRK